MKFASLSISGPIIPARLFYGQDLQDLQKFAHRHPSTMPFYQRSLSWHRLKSDEDKSKQTVPKLSEPAPIQSSERDKDVDLSDKDFSIFKDGYWFPFIPDYAMQKSGDDYIKSGATVYILHLGADSSYGQYSVCHCLILHCIDEELKRFERIGHIKERAGVVMDDWAAKEVVMKIMLV
jgi:hypothetical protein